MHLLNISLFPDKYPATDQYPFDLDIFQQTTRIEFTTPVTFFAGENGAGKSTLLEAISLQCGIHIWKSEERARYTLNPYEERLYQSMSVEWSNGSVPGSFLDPIFFSILHSF